MDARLPVVSLFSGAGGLDLAVERCRPELGAANDKASKPLRVAVALDWESDAQVVGLEDDADPLGAKFRPLGLIQLVGLLPTDVDVSGVGTHEPGDQCDEGGLPTARSADQAGGLAAPEVEVDPVEHVDLVRTGAVGLRHRLEAHQRWRMWLGVAHLARIVSGDRPKMSGSAFQACASSRNTSAFISARPPAISFLRLISWLDVEVPALSGPVEDETDLWRVGLTSFSVVDQVVSCGRTARSLRRWLASRHPTTVFENASITNAHQALHGASHDRRPALDADPGPGPRATLDLGLTDRLGGGGS